MRLFSMEAENSLTIVDWEDGFIGLSRKHGARKPFGFQLERWRCCPGSFECSIELFGWMLVAYNEGGPCHLEEFIEIVEHPFVGTVNTERPAASTNGKDWRTVPSPASR
jgi:hypothetical protein